VRLWDAQTGQAHGGPLRVGNATTKIGVANFSPDGTRVAAATSDTKSQTGVVTVWDVRTGNPIGPPMSHATAVSDWSFSPDGTRIATVAGTRATLATPNSARTLRLWDAHTAAPLCEPIPYGAELSPPLQFSPDGSRILMASLDATARLWDAYTGAPLGHPMRHDAAVVEAHWSPDGRRIITASIDQTARVWDARTGVQIGAPLHHEGVVWSARFSADGKRIITASRDHTAQIWDAETHLAMTGPMRHEWPVRFAVMSRDGAHVLTISMNRDKARIWPVLSTTDDDAPRLADLAEAVGGYRIDASNALVPVEDRARELQRLRSEFRPHSGSASDVDRVFEDLIVSGPEGVQ